MHFHAKKRLVLRRLKQGLCIGLCHFCSAERFGFYLLKKKATSEILVKKNSLRCKKLLSRYQ
jgi:hypothetical protein